MLVKLKIKLIIIVKYGKYITTPEFNTMTADVFKARLAAQKDLIS